MSRKEKYASRLGRLDIILELLRQGLSADKIEEELTTVKEGRLRGKAGERLGQYSEKSVIKALSGLAEIAHIERTRRGSAEDRLAKWDLIVYLRDPKIKRVGVQVKSSSTGIEEFRRQIAQEKGLGTDADIDNWLREQRIVVIYGQGGEENIRTSFRYQLKDISNA